MVIRRCLPLERKTCSFLNRKGTHCVGIEPMPDHCNRAARRARNHCTTAALGRCANFLPLPSSGCAGDAQRARRRYGKRNSEQVWQIAKKSGFAVLQTSYFPFNRQSNAVSVIWVRCFWAVDGDFKDEKVTAKTSRTSLAVLLRAR